MENIDKLLTKQKIYLFGYLILASVVIFSSAVQAELYKWVDENGNINYTQSPPPPGVDGTTIKPPPNLNSDSAQSRLEQRLDTLDKRADQRQKQAEEQQQAKSEMEEQTRICNQARARLASYQYPRVSVQGADGTSIQLGEEERQREVDKSQSQVNDLCK
jgi:hypothetical protein